MKIEITYSELSSASRLSEETSNELEEYENFLETKIKNKLSGMAGGHISDSIGMIQQKIKSLDVKKEKFSNLKKKIIDYRDLVQEKDNEVAKNIVKQTSEFAKQNEIKVSGISRAVMDFIINFKNGKLGQFVKDVFNKIKSVLKSVTETLKKVLESEFVKCIGDILLSGLAIAGAAITIGVGVGIFTAGGWIAVTIGAMVIASGGISIINSAIDIENTTKAIYELGKGNFDLATKYRKYNKLTDVLYANGYKTLANLINVGELACGAVAISCDVSALIKGGGLLKMKTATGNIFGKNGLISKRLFYDKGTRKLIFSKDKIKNGLISIKGDTNFWNGLKHNSKEVFKELFDPRKYDGNKMKNLKKTFKLNKNQQKVLKGLLMVNKTEDAIKTIKQNNIGLKTILGDFGDLKSKIMDLEELIGNTKLKIKEG